MVQLKLTQLNHNKINTHSYLDNCTNSIMTYFFTLKANWGGGEMVVVMEETFKAANNLQNDNAYDIVL